MNTIPTTRDLMDYDTIGDRKYDDEVEAGLWRVACWNCRGLAAVTVRDPNAELGAVREPCAVCGGRGHILTEAK